MQMVEYGYGIRRRVSLGGLRHLRERRTCSPVDSGFKGGICPFVDNMLYL